MICRPCPRCGKFVPVGVRCACSQPVQRGKRDRAYDARRDPLVVQFYHSGAWKTLRRKKLQDDPFCERCRMLGVKPVPVAVEVHHIQPVKSAWARRLDYWNLQSLCHRCHTLATKSERRQG